MALSQLEHYLSYHVRQLLPHVLSKRSSKQMAYVFSLLSAVSSGFIVMISLYSASWDKRLHYSAWQINMIASVSNLGMYLTPPVLGYVADSHGPITLSALGIVGFIPSYSYVAHIFNHPELSDDRSFHLILMCFALIGISTSSLYFSALITCAKLYPSRKTLSISFPTTCYGLSSLLGAQLLRLSYFWIEDSSNKYLNLGRVFNTFAWIYAAVGLLAWIATSTVSMLKSHPQRTVTQETYDENDPLIPVQSAEESLKQKKFFQDPTALFLGISMILSLGPSEMFVANMGSLTDLLLERSSSLSSQILSIYSVCSTVTRLSSGFLTDYLASKRISPKWILMSLLLLSLLTQLSITGMTLAPATVSSTQVILLGSFMGIVYGGLFTAYPVVVLSIWGDALFGTAYGSMMIAPAVGSVLSCMAYADIFDTRCVSSNSEATSCISPAFELTSFQLLICIVFSLFILKRY